MKELKKPVSRVLYIIVGILAGFVFTGVLYATTGFSIFGRVRENPTSSAEVSNAELTALAFSALRYIREGDYSALSRMVHPEFGLVFSPCATINLTTNKCFQVEQIASFGNDTKLYVWGVYSGSGQPIELTPADYFAEFVFDKDYTTAAVIGVNHIVRSGNALENITDLFREAQFVDFHFPGNGRDGSEDANWSTLRLAFEEHNGSLWLSLVQRSRYTV